MSRRKTAKAAITNRKSKVCAKILPMPGVPNRMVPSGLSMMSGSIDPIARNVRSALLKGRAKSRAKPTWAKRSILLG